MEQYGYNADRQPLRSDRADGQTVALQYDGAGRISVIDLASGALSFGYDGVDRLASVDTPGERIAYGYDGRLQTSATWSGAVVGTMSRTYDNDLRVNNTSVNGMLPIALQYDPDSLLIRAGGLSLTRSASTGLLSTTALDSVADASGYNAFGELTRYVANVGGSSAYAMDLSRDALGRITSKSETVGGATRLFTYTFDPRGRLTEVRQDGALVEAYVYDANGNRSSSSGPNGTRIATYDEQDRIAQFGSATLTHTANGERHTRSAGGQTTTYRHDSLGNLTGVSLPSGTQIDYVLDGNRRRAGRRINGTLTQGLLYGDSLRPIAELDGAGNVVSQFVYAGANVPAYMIRGGATFRIITDQVGSPRLIVDTASGAIVQRMDYDTFGNVLLDTNPGFQPFGFGGGLYDRLTGLVHFGGREYDAETGRWITKDPLGFGGGVANLYAYVANDPVNAVDIDGTCTGSTLCKCVNSPAGAKMCAEAGIISGSAGAAGGGAAAAGGASAAAGGSAAAAGGAAVCTEAIVGSGGVVAGEVAGGGGAFAATAVPEALAPTLAAPLTVESIAAEVPFLGSQAAGYEAVLAEEVALDEIPLLEEELEIEIEKEAIKESASRHIVNLLAKLFGP